MQFLLVPVKFIVYEEHADTWTTNDRNNGDAAFKAGTKLPKNDEQGKTSDKIGNGDADWKKSPWYLFPNSATGDKCEITESGQKCWSKVINGKTVHWCGRCFSKRYNRRGMWTSHVNQIHFTPHQHVNRSGNGNKHGANLATDRTPEESPPEDAAPESSAAVRPETSFSEALQHAAEGN